MKDEHSAGALKFVVETIDMTEGGKFNGFLASGARAHENPEVEEEIARLGDGAHKCPRCRNWHTVQHNPMDCCDRCVSAVSAMLPDLISSGAWTQESADEWRALVKESVNRWKTKT
jgi:hypothetical protein